MAKILIVDDAFVIRNTLKMFLTKAGHEIVGEANNGKVAVTSYERLMPDLVTMDITMPEKDGITATGEIIKKYPDARIIMISAMGQKEKVLEALGQGAKHFIIKPFDEKVVLKTIAKVLNIPEQTNVEKATESNVEGKAPLQKDSQLISGLRDTEKVSE